MPDRHAEMDADRKRMRMRAWRRGTREMDLVLGPYADVRLAGMAPDELALFDALLDEADQDLYPWVSGQVAAPPAYAALLADLAAFAASRHG